MAMAPTATTTSTSTIPKPFARWCATTRSAWNSPAIIPMSPAVLPRRKFQPGGFSSKCCARATAFRPIASMRITGSTSRTRVIARAANWRRWRASGGTRLAHDEAVGLRPPRKVRSLSPLAGRGENANLNRLGHPAEETVDQAATSPRDLRSRNLVLGDDALVEVIEEGHVVRLGDGEMLVADEHGVVVEERPDERHGGGCRAVLGDHEIRRLKSVRDHRLLQRGQAAHEFG